MQVGAANVTDSSVFSLSWHTSKPVLQLTLEKISFK